MAHRKRQAPGRRQLFAMISILCLVSVSLGDVFAQGSSDRQVGFEIRPKPLQAALLDFSEQAGVQLIIAADTRGMRLGSPLTGYMSLTDALEKLINGTDLEYHFTSGNTVTIRKKLLPQPVKKTAQALDRKDKPSEPPTNRIEEIISVGTRQRGRSATETPVPVDILTSSDLMQTGQSEVGRMIQMLAPSFNFSSSSVSDGTDALRPATLRGLSPDQTLVLVNGKRRHTSALVHVNTSVGRGSSGVDMNAIPAIALEQIEVLRDGAAAQYGSDAIAGVINLVLKKDKEGGLVSAQYGETYVGDGETLQLSASAGFPLGRDGFVHLAADYRDRGATNRAGLSGAVQYPLVGEGMCNSVTNQGCDPREFTFDRVNFRIGDAESEQKALMLNAEYPVSELVTFYTFMTYSNRENQSAGFYRRANQYDRTVLELYPDGFLPLINTTIEDHSLTAGLKGQVLETDVDLSVSYGENDFNYHISNSLNASLGALSPRQADAGTMAVSETLVNLDFLKPFPLGATESTLAFGMEYRNETYSLLAGEPASYADGGAQNYTCPGCADNPVLYQSGFQVFRGFSPNNEVDAKRHNVSLYMDFEFPVSDKWLLTAAARFEDYSDFGSRLTWKVSNRLDVNDLFSIRGSLSNGFRAPSVQQKNFNSVSTQFVDVNGETIAQERGTFRNDSDVARIAGVPALKEERSVNFSAGFAFSPGPVSLTVDYYHINIKDRIGISGAVDLTQPGFEGLNGEVSTGQFFINAADTKTDGVDVVASWQIITSSGHHLELGAAANWTDTDVVQGSVASSIGGVDVGPLLSAQDISILEEWQPKSRINFHANYGWKEFGLSARLSRFGKYTVCEGTCDTADNIQEFSAKLLTDLQVSYFFPDQGVTFRLGVNNLFNVKPDLNQIGQAREGDILGIVSSPGVFKYSRRSAPFGLNGGYWYFQASWRF